MPLILLLALGLRLALWAQPLHTPANDEVEYITVARDLLAGRGWVFYEGYHWLRAPLYPLFLAGSLWLAGGDLHRAALPNIALSVGLVGLVYLLAREVGGRGDGGTGGQGTRGEGRGAGGRLSAKALRASYANGYRLKRFAPATLTAISSAPLLAALLAALLLTNNTFASLYMAETLFACLFAASFLLLLRWRGRQKAKGERQRVGQGSSPSDVGSGPRAHRPAFGLPMGPWADWRLALAGVCFGLAVLTRSAPLFFLPVVLGWIAAAGWRGGAPAPADGGGTAATGAPAPADGDGARSAPTGGAAGGAGGAPVPADGGGAAATGGAAPADGGGAAATGGDGLAVRGLSAIGYRLSAITPALVFALCVGLTIAPWTIRNCLAYGRCILVETGLSYNLWAFSEPRESQAEIFRTLEQIPNPAERADEATRRGLERMREDPLIVARKLWPNWAYIWRVKPIQDRFLQVSYRADPPAPLFLAALVFDDLLALLIIVFGLAALGRAALRGQPAAILCALWVAYFVGVTMLTHGEARYRHFFLFVLVAYAAVGVQDLGGLRDLPGLHANRQGRLQVAPTVASALPLILALFVGYTFVRAYPFDYAIGGGLRSVNRVVGDFAMARGDLGGAEAAYGRALAASATPDGWLAVARVHAARGEAEQQADAYRAARSLALSYPLPHALLGDLLRREGQPDAARAAFVGRYVAESDMLAWSWGHLGGAPDGRVEVGDGLDFGYVAGLYDAEPLAGARARWSGPEARLRIPGDARMLRIRLAAPRPDAATTRVSLCADTFCQPVDIGPAWRVVSLALPASEAPSREILLRAAVFAAADGRDLGVVVDWFEGKK